MTIETDKILLLDKAGLENCGPVKAKNNPLNNLPTSTCFRPDLVEEATSNFAESVNIVRNNNANLCEPERNFSDNIRDSVMSTSQRFLTRMGILAFSQPQKKLHAAASKLQHPPKCAACQFGKQRSRAIPGKKTTNVKDRAGIISADQIEGVCGSFGLFNQRTASLWIWRQESFNR
jgi:hypothetical protein